MKAKKGPRALLAVACAAAALVLGIAGAPVANGATPDTPRAGAAASPHPGPRAKPWHRHSRQSARSGHGGPKTRVPSRRGRRKREGARPVQQSPAGGMESQGSREQAEQVAERSLEAAEQAEEAAEEAAEKKAEEDAE